MEKFNQISYQNEYNKINYDRFGLLVPKGQKEEIKKEAQKAGKSMNEFLNDIIAEA